MDVEVGLIRETWAKAAAAGPLTAQLFYGRLFKIAPETRRLFADDMTRQEQKLTATLGFVVDHLDRPETLLPAARDLAIRHIGYGVEAEDYAPVGAALIWALERLLGSDFGPAERAAWVKAYATLSDDMISNAYGSTAA